MENEEEQIFLIHTDMQLNVKNCYIKNDLFWFLLKALI